jgi:hypothetical protein
MDAIVRCKSDFPVVEEEHYVVDNYPKVVGKIELPEGDSFKWHRGVDGGLYEDYEQSIGE